MNKKLKIGDKVFYSPELRHGNIAGRCKLPQLRPHEGKIVRVHEGESRFRGTMVRYSIKGRGIRLDENIHTVFKTELEYYNYLGDEIGGTYEKYPKLIRGIIKYFK